MFRIITGDGIGVNVHLLKTFFEFCILYPAESWFAGRPETYWINLNVYVGNVVIFGLQLDNEFFGLNVCNIMFSVVRER